MDLRTGTPYWPLRSGLIGVYPALELDDTCDVAVLGAGITGALVAWRLASAGCDVVVLDRNDVGMGSTAASTGSTTALTSAASARAPEASRSRPAVGPAHVLRARLWRQRDHVRNDCRGFDPDWWRGRTNGDQRLFAFDR